MSKFKACMSEFFKNGKPFFAVIFIQFGFAGMDILSKAALNEGISNYVFVVYRHAVATIVMAPFALIFDRKIRPKMTRSVFIKIIFLGLLEPVIDQNLFFMGMKATTATFTAAMVNILPAITFVMACILRLEKLNLKGIRSQAKVVGTITTVAGAMVMTLMKGPIIELFWTKGRTYHEVGNQGVDFRHSIKGATMIAVGCFSWSGFMVLQAITLKSYPAELSLTVWICLMGTIEGALVALIMERGNTAVWALKWNTSLVAVLYTGIVCSGLAFYISGIVMKTRGPVFVTAFSPLSMIIVAVMGSIILAEQMYLGRVMGAIVIVAGLYLVVWGKSKDQDEVVKSLSADEELPQIQDKEFKENRNDKIITIKTSDGVSDHHNPINGLA
ncbi:putative EamA domain-containing protein [Helianthus annuus]|uniref:WAT1-related protein n=1 Tax=Helianthus annuus TaxID=4232 RepID=A0A251SRG0_HELAN|nr:WAT1-related protein At2g37460 [Helianthus annuus]KAF5772993.1 putative EamA domain-containing protein [Helianthus annuus]KAJ0476539.1 putative EamA domain-containing protein [Helianthus annuus]KAJ0480779.1 putative EamA domain-containing protein [Helianthus annuus]KAJ0497366.1 putative EamA domain-containing protein [Helianthus annuus]KAJ0663380.1 putative EamA domain-containing protein [Helianthus annuus]